MISTVFIIAPMLFAAGMPGSGSGEIAIGSDELVLSTQAYTNPLHSGQDALYRVTLHNVGKTDQIIDLASVQQVGVSFFGQESASLTSDVQTDNSFSARKCLDPRGLAVIKPGSEVTVLIKVPTPKNLFGRVDLTLIVGFWTVVDLPMCKGKRIEMAAGRIPTVEIMK